MKTETPVIHVCETWACHVSDHVSSASELAALRATLAEIRALIVSYDHGAFSIDTVRAIRKAVQS